MLNKIKIKKIIKITLYLSAIAYFVLSFMAAFGSISINSTSFLSREYEKLNNLFSIIIIIWLITEILRFFSRNDDELINKRKLVILSRKENVHSIIKLMFLIVPLLLLRMTKFLFSKTFNSNLPVMTEMLSIAIIVISLAIVITAIYIITIYIFKKDWLTEETGDINLSTWIDTYKPNNTKNNECDEINTIVLIEFIKHFLACTTKEINLTIQSNKTKAIVNNRMRNMPPINN
ncbi:hypothetical protein CK556_02835 [Mesoplasma chauliocola]|uniref:Uncharacterized protein n=1 Tax=Mesoplasma chauliocola TaxID=216427 RepID=A0A249SNN0_9MOLU|nr:hypothetical protein [Mesoplasma chauliocola]ASZ09274.1 hypothetical protein CK556_02835 [Mesoplasma chauliocola]